MTPGYDGVLYAGVFVFILLALDILEIVRWIRGKD